MKQKKAKTIDQIFAEGKPIDAALRKAARVAQLQHKLAGLPLVVWRNGKVAYIPPEKIKVTLPAIRKKAS